MIDSGQAFRLGVPRDREHLLTRRAQARANGSQNLQRDTARAASAPLPLGNDERGENGQAPKGDLLAHGVLLVRGLGLQPKRRAVRRRGAHPPKVPRELEYVGPVEPSAPDAERGVTWAMRRNYARNAFALFAVHAFPSDESPPTSNAGAWSPEGEGAGCGSTSIVETDAVSEACSGFCTCST